MNAGLENNSTEQRFSSIDIFNEDIDFELQAHSEVLAWLSTTISTEGKTAGEISIIFCSDEHLLKINQEHLDHDYYTDIITFQYRDEPVSGDLFISIDRVIENARDFGVDFKDELHRVMVHGVLHLCGYKDKSDHDEKLMREKEDFYLAQRLFYEKR